MEVCFAEVCSYKNSLIEFLTLWESVDNFAVYVFNLDHLVSFFVAKIRFLFHLGKSITQVTGT